jgi:peptidyl-prolyl cis-trans isomerase B (cyclophilin B)
VSTKDQRRRQLARDKFERQQQRRAQARKRIRRRNSLIAGVVAVVVAAVGAAYAGGLVPSGKKADADAASAASKAPDPCAKAQAGKPGTEQWKKEPSVTIDNNAKYTFTLDTTCGAIPIALEAAKAPHTVNSFKFLADKGFFDHTKCHRLTTAGIYVLQCGDPTGTGSGGPGYTIPDENLTAKSISKGVYPAGTVAMANQYDASSGQGKNTGGSQFFLVYRDSRLSPNYTPFGTVSASGMRVLRKIAAAGAQAPDPTTGNTAPNATVVINKATVKES